tara:strand:- start:296 stop:592 length:297 start_codon:yes stop_codon:yes gene_type:complete
MTNQTLNKEVQNFFNNLIAQKIGLTNDLFLQAVEIQKKQMKNYIKNGNHNSSYFLSDEDLADYVEFLNEESELIFADDFDIVVAQNDRADAIASIFNN